MYPPSGSGSPLLAGGGCTQGGGVFAQGLNPLILSRFHAGLAATWILNLIAINKTKNALTYSYANCLTFLWGDDAIPHSSVGRGGEIGIGTALPTEHR